jgi:hypothetical protein
MASSVTLPEGFVLEDQQPASRPSVALPSGFEIEQPSTLQDIRQTIPAAAVRAATTTMGTGGDVRATVGGYGAALGGLVGAPETGRQIAESAVQNFPMVGSFFRGPTTQQLRSATERELTGPLYQPQTPGGKLTETAIQLAPGAAFGPGGLARRAITNVAIPTLASEAAGALTEGSAAEPYARAAVAGVAGLGAGAAASRLLDPRLAKLTVEQVRSAATKLYQAPELQTARFSPSSLETLSDNATTTLQNKSFGSVGAEGAYNAASNLKKIQPTIGEIRDIDKRLTEMAGELNAQGKPTENATAALLVKQQIRNFLDNPAPHLTQGDPNKITQLLRAANQNWAAQATAFELPATLKAAQRYAKKYEIPIDEALQQRAKALTPEERQAAAQAISGGRLGQTINFLSGLSPAKSALSLGANVLGFALNPYISGPIGAVGTVADVANRLMRASRVRGLRQDILNRSALGQSPQYQTGAPYVPNPAIPGVRIQNPYYVPPSFVPPWFAPAVISGLLAGRASP